MAMTTIGDLSQSFLLQRHQAALQARSLRLQSEVTTGKVADTRSHLRGDYIHLGEIERGLALVESYRTAIAEGEIVTESLQSALGAVQQVTSDVASGLLLAAQSGSPLGVETGAQQAGAAFETLVAQLNARAGDRSLFAGAAYDSPALAPPQAMLEALRGAMHGAASLAEVQEALDGWFGSGGGFETQGYLGATQDGAAVQLSEDLRLSLSLRADDPVFRDLLKAVAMAALAADKSLPFDTKLRRQMVEAGGSGLMTAQSGLTDTLAGLGLQQARIEDSRARAEAAGFALERSRSTLLSADPFEAATRFEAVQSQIEALYAVSARATRLRFLDYMR